MIIPLSRMIKDYVLDIQGVIHIGAHYGQEYADYVACGIENMILFEPAKSNYKKLLEVLPEKESIKTFNLALGNETGERMMYVETANQGKSNSLLPPGTHLAMYPRIKFDIQDQEMVKIDKLDNIYFYRGLYNMINIDVQGFELEVFRGAEKTLQSIDIIYTEINLEDVYKGCCQVEDLDDFLKPFGFIRILHKDNDSWGDALYLKYI